MNSDQIGALLASQKVAFSKAHPEDLSIRIDRLNRLKALLLENADTIISTEYEDFGGRCPTLTRAADILGGVGAVEYNITNLHSWAAPHSIDLPADVAATGASVRVDYQPLGVVGVVTPWNGPFLLSTIAAAGVFAAGNRLMLKPSELSPKSSALLQSLFSEYFASEEAVVILGEADIAKAFVSQPFDHLLFTGSTNVGRHVMKAAADNLVPVTLELGGKSPVIIGEMRAENKAAVITRLAHAKLLFGGQVCVTPDYVLVPKGHGSQVAPLIVQAAQQLYPQVSGNADYTAIINDQNVRRLDALIEDAKAKGASSLIAGDLERPANDKRYNLHVLTNVTMDMQVMQEEIFGPILPILEFDTIDDAIALINAGPRPLSAYYYGDDAAQAEYVAQRIWTGSMCVNDSLTQIFHEAIPFGGVGNSGFGRYRGHEGFKTFSNQRPIFYQTPKDELLAPMRPPYTQGTKDYLSGATDTLKDALT
jgi:coniferyl-aldehyde dehydrogenase